MGFCCKLKQQNVNQNEVMALTLDRIICFVRLPTSDRVTDGRLTKVRRDTRTL